MFPGLFSLMSTEQAWLVTIFRSEEVDMVLWQLELQPGECYRAVKKSTHAYELVHENSVLNRARASLGL